MTEQYKKGDRVKVTIEGIVTHALRDGRGLDIAADPDGEPILSTYRGAEQFIEKLEPPVEVFKPGDVVRSPITRNVYALTERGFVRLSGRGFTGTRNGVEVPYRTDLFTSEHFERVSLG